MTGRLADQASQPSYSAKSPNAVSMKWRVLTAHKVTTGAWRTQASPAGWKTLPPHPHWFILSRGVPAATRAGSGLPNCTKATSGLTSTAMLL